MRCGQDTAQRRPLDSKGTGTKRKKRKNVAASRQRKRDVESTHLAVSAAGSLTCRRGGVRKARPGPLGILVCAHSLRVEGLIPGDVARRMTAGALPATSGLAKYSEKTHLPQGLQKSPEWVTGRKRVRTPGPQKRASPTWLRGGCVVGSAWGQCADWPPS